MPYASNRELPPEVRKLSPHQQDIWRKTFNAAFKNYKGNEQKAFGTAWAAAHGTTEHKKKATKDAAMQPEKGEGKTDLQVKKSEKKKRPAGAILAKPLVGDAWGPKAWAASAAARAARAKGKQEWNEEQKKILARTPKHLRELVSARMRGPEAVHQYRVRHGLEGGKSGTHPEYSAARHAVTPAGAKERAAHNALGKEQQKMLAETPAHLREIVEARLRGPEAVKAYRLKHGIDKSEAPAIAGSPRQTTANYWAGHKFGSPARWR